MHPLCLSSVHDGRGGKRSPIVGAAGDSHPDQSCSTFFGRDDVGVSTVRHQHRAQEMDQ